MHSQFSPHVWQHQNLAADWSHPEAQDKASRGAAVLTGREVKPELGTRAGTGSCPALQAESAFQRLELES